MIFSILQVSRDRKRWLTASVRPFTLCGILLEKLISRNNESFAAALCKRQQYSLICFVHECSWLCCNVDCHVFRNDSVKFKDASV